MLTLEQGKLLVRYARECINCNLMRKDMENKEFSFAKDNQGVFVTLLTYPEKDLRGCIGFPEPVYPLTVS